MKLVHVAYQSGSNLVRQVGPNFGEGLKKAALAAGSAGVVAAKGAGVVAFATNPVTLAVGAVVATGVIGAEVIGRNSKK